MYGLCITIGVIICIFVVLPAVMKKYRMSKKANDFYSMMGLIAIAAGFAGAFVFQFIYDWIDKGWAVAWQEKGGITFLGGLLTGAGTFALGTFLAKPEVKKEFWIILRAFAPCVCIAHAFGRLGCFCAGCCYGVETDSSIGIKFPIYSSAGDLIGHTAPRVPTQLIEAFFLFALFAMCFLYTDKSMIIYLFSYGIFRFVLELFRGDDRGFTLFNFFSPSQLICIGLFITAGVLVYLDITKGIFKRYFPPAPLPEVETAYADIDADIAVDGTAGSADGTPDVQEPPQGK